MALRLRSVAAICDCGRGDTRLGAPRSGAPSTAPVERRLGEGSEGPLWTGLGLPLGRLGHR
eukprot:9052322-Alexandrium_andersonii.AAC.1